MGLISDQVMRANYIIFVAIFSIAVTSCYSQNESSVIAYYDLRTRITLSFDIENKVFSNGHRSLGLFICPDHLDFVCVLGGPSFAVPREFEPRQKEWVFNENTYTNLGSEKLTLMGKEYLVYRIEVADSGGWLWYLYSIKYGVIALGTRSVNGIDNAYYLQNSCGLGGNC